MHVPAGDCATTKRDSGDDGNDKDDGGKWQLCDNRGMSGDVSVNISWSGGGDTVCSNDAANGDSSDADNGDESLHQPFHH